MMVGKRATVSSAQAFYTYRPIAFLRAEMTVFQTFNTKKLKHRPRTKYRDVYLVNMADNLTAVFGVSAITARYKESCHNSYLYLIPTTKHA